MRSHTGTFARLTFGVMLTTIVAGCVSTSAPDRTGLMTEASNVTADARQVTMRIDEFTGLWLGAVEWRADMIRSASDDPEVRRNALLWKINASSAMLRATGHNDPLIALMDAWTLVYQFKDYFESGQGADNFGDQIHIARELSVAAIQEIETVAVRISNTEGVANGRRIAADFAAREPIVNEYYLRRSVANDLVESLPTETRTAFASLGTITQTVESLSSRLTLYLAFLPKQARWQAEFMLEDPNTSGMLAGALEDVSSIDDTADRLADTLDHAVDDVLPETVEGIIEVLRAEVDAIEALVDSERELILNRLPEEYAEIFALVTEQREEALRRVEIKVDNVIAEVDQIAQRTLGDAEGLTRGTVDYAFERAVPYLIAAFFGLFILFLVYRLVPQRVRTD
ncbi:MAG: hypothetical protein GKS06_15175 [Acidobacteria bacterium]|nr:hypothetical protein [Acidobacteriota bacterium]